MLPSDKKPGGMVSEVPVVNREVTFVEPMRITKTAYPEGVKPVGGFQPSVGVVVLDAVALNKLVPFNVGFCTGEMSGAIGPVKVVVIKPLLAHRASPLTAMV
jgi:hypothetical protein